MSKVWDRRVTHATVHSLSRQAFMGLVTAFLFAGILFASLAATISHGWDVESWNSWAFLGFALAVLAVSIFGTYVYNKYDHPALSLLGYALVAGPFGLLLGPVIAMYSPDSVAKAFISTLFIVGILGAIGTVIPESLESWRPYLIGALLVLLCGMFVVPFFGAGAMTVWDWVGIAVFSALVVFDFNRASRMERTIDNSIDAAAAVFMDFINIFIRMLGIQGKD